MKKRQSILAVLLATLCFTNANATVTITAPTKPDFIVNEIEAGKSYYLFNVGKQQFMNQSTSNTSYTGWSDTPYAFRFNQPADGQFSLWQGSGYIGADGNYVLWNYSTSSTSSNVKHTITLNEDGETFKIKSVGYNTYIGYNSSSSYGYRNVSGNNANWYVISADATDMNINDALMYIVRKPLYDAIVAADARGEHIERYEDIYNDASKTYAQLNNVANELNNSNTLSNAHSYLFPSWSDYPITITSLGNWERYSSYSYLRRGTSSSSSGSSNPNKGTTNTLKTSVYVDQPSTLSFILDCDQRWTNEPTMPIQVFVDGELVYDYKGETDVYYYDSYLGSVLHGTSGSNYRPYGQYYNYNAGYQGYNRHFINLEPGHHLVDIVTTQNYDGTNWFYTYFRQIGVEKVPTVEVNLAKEGSLGDEVLRAMDNNPLIAESNIRNVRRLKISGKMGDADFNELYNMTELYALDLTDANLTEIKTGQLSQYYHNSLENLHELKLPKVLKTIGQEAFYATYIDDVDIPESVTAIGDFAFFDTRLREANIPNVTSIGHNAFRGCTMLNKVVMKNVEWMGINAFAGCYNLKDVMFEGTLSTVPQRAFDQCDEIENISIPETVTKIETYAFYINRKSKIQKLPSNLSTVESYAFYQNYDATFEFPQMLQTINEYAFQYCHRVYGDIPSALTTVGSSAFANTYCYNMPDTLHLSSKATYGSSVFQYSRLKNVVIPENFNNFNVSKAFANCDSLKSIKFMSSTKVTVPSDFVDGLNKKNLKILVPDYLRTTYMRDSYWMDFTIEGFSTTEIDSVVVRQNLALSQHDRFEGTPSLDINNGVIFELEGAAGMDLKHVNLNSNLSNDSYAQIVSGTDYVEINGDVTQRIYTAANKWYFMSLPFDCDLSRTTNADAKYAIRYYNGAGRAQDNSSLTNLIDKTIYAYPESAHNYSPNLNENSSGNKKTFIYQDAKQLIVFFNSKCWVQEGGPNDLIHIRDANGKETTYDGGELSNARVVLDGDRFEIWITSDGRGIEGYGYSIDYIYVNNEEGVDYKTWKNYDCTKDIIPAGTGFIFMTSKDSWTRFYSVDNSLKNRVFENSENEQNEFHYPLQKHPSELSANRGWNLVGNPYPNYYNNHKISFAAPITLWDGTTYKAYSLRDDDIAIKPNQAVFVQCPETTAEISWPVAGRQTTSVVTDQANARPRGDVESRRQIVDLSLTNGAYTDDTRVVINEDASLNYEVGSDAGKFMSLETGVQQLYSLDGVNNRYAINERPVDNGTVKLGIYIPADGTYTFTLKRNQAHRVLLTDTETGFAHDLTADDYVFTAKAGTSDNRFTLTVVAAEASAISNVNSIEQADTEIYSVDGIRLKKNAKSGAYIMRNGKKSSKVLVK